MAKMFYGANRLIFQRAAELRKNQTKEEQILWQYLKANQLGVRFKRQHPVWMYIADFYSHELRLVIEIDGSVHDLKEVKENDIVREEAIKSFGIQVVRFSNSEVRNSIEEVVNKIRIIVIEIKNNGFKRQVPT